ncbi:ribosome hibernation-promoting factor, HPF/YfiA family [Candidatus Eisenbacteria bacterium]|uniref:Ribosome hibernation-promoting factor, HPF/YfiA family n=1 Tax=Eiseniibacteriota bacterium TaxID=2212470 RepID=A0ABV6YMS4_UNCEI
MRLEITQRSVDLSEGTKEHMEARLLKLKKFFDGVLDCHVFASLERFIYKFEITLHGTGFDLFAEAHDQDLHAAFESAADKMERQVKKVKGKILDRRVRKPGIPDPEGEETDEFSDLTEEYEET